MERQTTKVSVSAGGIVLNAKGEILLVHQDSITWSFPKGHVEAGEDPLHAALREILEEAGLSSRSLGFVKMLGSYGRYKIGLNSIDDKKEWKILIFFLFKIKSKNVRAIRPLHPQAQWITQDRVENLLTHPRDKAFYKSIKSML